MPCFAVSGGAREQSVFLLFFFPLSKSAAPGLRLSEKNFAPGPCLLRTGGAVFVLGRFRVSGPGNPAPTKLNEHLNVTSRSHSPENGGSSRRSRI